MTLKDLTHGIECPDCGDSAFLRDVGGYLCDAGGKRVHDGDPTICECRAWLSADEDGCSVAVDEVPE